MVPVEADLFESVGYVTGARQLYIKFHKSPALCFNNVPGFRYEGLLAAPRKDAYYNHLHQKFLPVKNRRTAAANLIPTRTCLSRGTV